MTEEKIFLLDDHPAIQDALESSIKKDASLTVVGRANGVEKIIDKLKNTHPNTLIADIQLKDTLLFSFISDIQRELPDLAIIVFSMHCTQEYVLQSLKAGIHGYITKETSIDCMLKGIKTVNAGGYFFDSNVMSVITKIMSTLPGKIRIEEEEYEGLTEREQQIFRFLAEGYSAKNIAFFLSLSPGTVQNYQTSIYRKLGISTPTELLRYAMEIGIISNK